ncbi:hypothetical protein [Streptomyces sp. NPDC056938]
MDSVVPCLQLRPPGGGREWDADPNRVRAGFGIAVANYSTYRHDIARR